MRWDNEAFHILDQTRLPFEESYLPCRRHEEVVDAIRRLAVRGAPNIGIAAAYGATLAARAALKLTFGERHSFIKRALGELEGARPTAVNLKWSVRSMQLAWSSIGESCTEEVVPRFLTEARRLEDAERASNERIAELGASILPAGDVVTHCNTGTLASVGLGTALGVIRESHRLGKVGRVYTCETRPLLQGLRLTAWELGRAQIPFTAICDSMAAWLMKTKRPVAVIVGADRIAGNGDVANKIGTYALAILARHHEIPFFVAAPVTTFDIALASGAEIPIEERAPDEIFSILGKGGQLKSGTAWNPSFDMTPHELITAIICEKGIAYPPYHDTLRDVLER